MEPTIKELNTKQTLLNTISINGKDVTEINIKKLIFRPVLKRIVFIVDELDRVIVYEGDTDYNTHKDDTDDTLINVLLTKIDSDYKK